MATKRVVSYFMHAHERDYAKKLMNSAEFTDSFVIGNVEEDRIPTLRDAGLIVQEYHTSHPTWQAVRSTQDTETVSASVVPNLDPTSIAAPAPIDYYFVTLRGPLIEGWRDELNKVGIKLLQRVPEHGYKARLYADQVPQVRGLGFVESVEWIEPSRSKPRILTDVTSRDPGLEASLELPVRTWDVRLHQTEDRTKVEAWLKNKNVVILGSSPLKFRIKSVADAAVLTDLSHLSEVDTIIEYVPPKLCNDRARRILGIESLGNFGSELTVNIAQDGSGQIIAIADTGIDDEHPDFQGRIIAKIGLGRPKDTTDPLGHGTHVAGSLLGDGTASNGQLRGVAPKAQLYFQSLLDDHGGLSGMPFDLNDLFEPAYQAGARIHNDSWGALTPAIYTTDSEETDEFIRNHPDLLIVIAAGNEGTSANPRRAAKGFVDWLSVGSPASCKNALTVGASRSDRTDGPMSNMTYRTAWPLLHPSSPIGDEKVSGDPNCLAAFSSRGPSDDRRIKPDLVAPGTDIASTRSSTGSIFTCWGPYPGNVKYAFDGGTSMAAPLVSGCAALIRQYYLDECAHTPSAALLKATLINSTEWLTGIDSTAPTPGRPNYHQGYGLVSMTKAVPNRANTQLRLSFIDNWQNIDKQFTTTGEKRKYTLNVPEGSGELRITLAYTDYPGRALQNNLNLLVQHEVSTRKWMGNEALPDALVLPDGDNNVESIRIDRPAAGAYTIHVFAANILKRPQDFALVVTGDSIFPLAES